MRIILWNSNSLYQHKEELNIFLRTHNIDIALITETRFTDKTCFQIPNYQTFTTLHPDGTPRGGTAVLIKNSIPHEEYPSYSSYKIQATNVKINTTPFPLVISAVYCPPRFPISPAEFSHLFQTLGNTFIVGGDWNAKHTYWGSRATTTRGRNLFQGTRNGRFNYISTGEPTYWPSDPHKIPDLIDFFITHNISNENTLIESIHDLSSDHSPVLLTFSTNYTMKSPKPTLTSIKTEWEDFRWFLDQKITLDIRLKTDDDIDKAVDELTKYIQESALYATPKRLENPNRSSINTPTNIADLITQKRRARQIWQTSRNHNDKTTLNKLTRQLQKLLRERRQKEIETYLISLSPEDNSIWKPTKK